jgi:hypothetical protein
MSNSPILAIPEIAPNQNNKYITHNDAIAWLEAAANDILVKSAILAGPVTLSAVEATKYFVYRLSGGSAAFDVVFPSTINSNNAKRVFAVRNEDSAYAATIKASTGTGATVVLRPGETAIIFQSFEDMYPVGVVNAYDVAFFAAGTPADNGIIGTFVATRAFKLLDDFAGSRGHCVVNPDSTATFTVQKNGVTIGTVAISNVGAFTFATTGSAVESFAVGDRLTLIAPTPQDASLANVAISFFGILG